MGGERCLLEPQLSFTMAALMQKSSVSAFTGRKAFAARPAVAARPASRSAVTVRAEFAPLVGNKAPAFKAQAVYDQEFIEVTLDKYKGKYVVLFFCEWRGARA
jgi:hypothetical protein